MIGDLLIERIEKSLAYFCDEFPKDKYPEVWSGPVSRHGGGITPTDLQSILTMLCVANKTEVKRGEIQDTGPSGMGEHCREVAQDRTTCLNGQRAVETLPLPQTEWPHDLPPLASDYEQTIEALRAEIKRLNKRKLLDPDMPAQELRLHMGELTAEEVRVASAAIRWANTRIEGEKS